MTLRSFDKRVQVLEQRTGGAGFACILQRVGETKTEAVGQWEAEHGSIGDRQAFVVTLVSAALS